MRYFRPFLTRFGRVPRLPMCAASGCREGHPQRPRRSTNVRELGMPFMTTPERFGWEKGLLQGIEVCLDIKFGAEGLKLMPEIRSLEDHEVLRAVLQTLRTANTPAEVRRIWAP